MNPAASDYLEIVRQLPRPTLAQTERFARFVSNAHSWYKHLPIHPKVPFVFYLEPGAGMNFVQTRTGESALVEITDESTRFHYTWQKTEDYRRRFGYWNYHAAYGTSFMYAGEGGIVSTAGPQLRVLAESGDWVSVPPELVEAGTALVNAFVHPHSNFHIWAADPERFGLTLLSEPADSRFQPPTHVVLGLVWTALQQDRHFQPCQKWIPQRVLESSQVPSRGRGWDWPSEALVEELQAAGVEAERIPSVVKNMEVEQGRLLLREGTQSSPEWPSAVLFTLGAEILEERGRQLEAMTDAMGRLVETIYAA